MTEWALGAILLVAAATVMMVCEVVLVMLASREEGQ